MRHFSNKANAGKPRASLHAFTLLEMLVVISIMVILFGMGIGSYRKLTGQMEQVFNSSDAKQLIISTIQECRKNQIPMIVQFKTGNVLNGQGSGTFSMQGSQSTLVGYWNFDNADPMFGINRMPLATGTINPTNGILGKGQMFSTNQSLQTGAHERLNCSNDYYFECNIKPNVNSLTSTYVIMDGGGGLTQLLLKTSADGAYLDATGLNDAAQNTHYPDDNLWHKVGLLKIRDLGVYLYLDDLLIGKRNFISPTDNNAHVISLGHNYLGQMDEVKFYRIGDGQMLVMKGNGLIFSIEPEPPTGRPETSYNMFISPLGVVNGIYKSGSSSPIFPYHSYVYMQPGLKCTIAGSGYETNDTSSTTHVNKLLDATITGRDSGFPDSGYAWVMDNLDDGISAAEIVSYIVFDGGQKLKITGVDQMGSNGKGPLGLDEVNLQYVEPITITRTGDVL